MRKILAVALVLMLAGSTFAAPPTGDPVKDVLRGDIVLLCAGVPPIYHNDSQPADITTMYSVKVSTDISAGYWRCFRKDGKAIMESYIPATSTGGYPSVIQFGELYLAPRCTTCPNQRR